LYPDGQIIIPSPNSSPIYFYIGIEFGVVFYVWGGLHYKDSIAEYLYNANGSMTKDLNKGITEIK